VSWWLTDPTINVAPMPTSDVDMSSNQVFPAPPRKQGPRRIAGCSLIARIPREPAQHAELKNEAPSPGGAGNRSLVLWDTIPQVHAAERDAGWGVKGRQQPPPEVLGEPEEGAVVAGVIGEEMSREEAYGSRFEGYVSIR